MTRARAIDAFCIVASVLIVLAILLHASAQEQQAAPTTTTQGTIPVKPSQVPPNEVQALALENAQLKVFAAQRGLRDAAQNWSNVCEAVKQANGWPREAVCELNSSPVALRIPPPQQSRPRPKDAEPPKDKP